MPAPPSRAQTDAKNAAAKSSVSPAGGKGGTSSGSKSSPSGGMKSGPGATGGAKTANSTKTNSQTQKQSTPTKQSQTAGRVPGSSAAASKANALGKVAQQASRNASPGYSFSPAQNAARVNAISRGPGVVSGALPGNTNPVAQRRTLTAFGNSIAEDPRFGVSYGPRALGMLPKAVIGEAQNEGDVGRAAVANVMMNRLGLGIRDPSSYGYLGAGSIPRMMRGIDAAGVDPNRPGLRPNAGYRNTVPGTEAYSDGLRAVADSLSPYSEFSRTATPRALNATHYYNDAISNPKWGEARSGTPFDRIGNHVFGNAERTAGQVASIRGGPPTDTQFASAAIGSIPRPVPRPSDLRGPVPRPTPRPDSFPRGFGDTGIGRAINPYSPAPPVPNMRPDSFPRGFGDTGVGRTVNPYTPPSFGDQGVGRTVNPYSAPAFNGFGDTGIGRTVNPYSPPVPVPTARPDSFPRGFGDQGVGRPVNPFSAPVSPFSDAGIRKPVTPFAGQPAANIVPPIPKARPPMQGPQRPVGGMSFTPGLPGPQKRYYDRVASADGFVPAGMVKDQTRLPPAQAGMSFNGMPGQMSVPQMSPFGNVGQEYHQHEAPPTPSQYRNEMPPAAPNRGTPASQTADAGKPSLWSDPGAYFKEKTGIDPNQVRQVTTQVQEGIKEIGDNIEKHGVQGVQDRINQMTGMGIPAALKGSDGRDKEPQPARYAAPMPTMPPQQAEQQPEASQGELIALLDAMRQKGATPEEIAFVESLITPTA